jgi:hypothetical protein
MPNSSTSWVPSGLWLLLLAGLGFAGYWHFDRTHLSSGLRQTLAAAVDPSSTDSDVLMDLRNARLQIHTTRDAEVEARLERAVQLTQSAAQASQRTNSSATGTSADRNLDKYLALERQYKRTNKEVPQSLKDYIQRATQEEQKAQSKPDATEELDQQVSQEDSAQAAQLFQQLRADLGLPPLPSR